MSSFTYGSIALKPVVPPSLTSMIIPGSEAASAEGVYGKILFQAIHAGDITFLYNIYQAEEDIAIDFQCNPEAIQIHAAMKNDSHFYIRGIGDLYLAEGQFNILDAPRLEGTYFLEGGHEYRTLHIDFSSTLLEKLLPAFPYLEEWLASGSPRPRLLFKVNSWLSEQLKDISERILQATYNNGLQQVYNEMKATEFVFLALSPGSMEITPSVRLTRHNTTVIHESKQILDQSFDQHITVSSVARQVGMNEFKLKAGFKQIFGISMFEYLMKTRMQMARTLLLETDKPIKEIASLTGYSTKQSFLSAFKRYFHDTPGSFRKN